MSEEKNMFCRNCGNRLDDDALFCPNCGIKVQNLNFVEKSNAEKENEKDLASLENEQDNIPQAEKSQTENRSKSEIAVAETAPQKNNGGFIAGIIIFVFALIAGGIYFIKQNQNKSPWVSDDTLNLDILKADVCSFTNNDGEVETLNCYKVPKKDLEKIFADFTAKKKISFIYSQRNWSPFEPETRQISDYVESIRPLMRKYDVICTQIYHYDNGNPYFFMYVINRETEEVMAL